MNNTLKLHGRRRFSRLRFGLKVPRLRFELVLPRLRCGLAVLLLASLLASGCMTGGGSLAANSPPGALADDMVNTQNMVARLQQPDDPKKPFDPPQTPPQQAPSLSGLTPPPNVTTPGAVNPGDVHVLMVRAWVNGRPLFEDEFAMMPYYELSMDRLRKFPNDPKIKEDLAEKRNVLIDLELMYQDACYKLDKINPKVLEKLKKDAEKKYEENLISMRQNFRKQHARDSEADYRKKEAGFLQYLKSVDCLLRRQSERSFLGDEYSKGRIIPKIFSLIGPLEVKQEYDTHTNQYIYPGKLKWQDVFIPLSEHNNSLAETHSYAQRLLAHYRDDFRTLLQYDKGDSKNRGGEGIGSHPTYKREGKTILTDVRPADLEPYLVKMRDGETAVVDTVNGVHIIRLVKYEESYQRPFNKEVQVEIRNKLRSELFQRERKALIRELRTRADIVVIGD